MGAARTTHAQVRNEASWTSTQAYILAAFCLVLGVALGYLFRGSGSAVEETATATTANSSAPQGASQNQPGPEQQKEIIKRTAAPLLATLNANPNDFDTLVKVANLYYDGQQFPEAIKYYERALKISPENADVRTDFGTALWYMGEADKAIAEFQKSLKSRPGHPETLFNLGVVRWQGKMDPKGAVQSWEELLRQNPNYPQREQVLQFIEKAKQHPPIKG